MRHSERNSSIELLRIVCMLFVIAQHVIVFGVQPQWLSESLVGGTDYAIGHACYGWFVTAVDIFVLISGWFSIKFNWRKIRTIWLMVLTYSWAFLVIKILTNGVGGVNVKDLSLVFPILSRKFWFVSVYFILCFLAPALNKLVEVSSRNEMRWIVLILIVVTYLWATLSYFLNFPQIIPDFGGGIVNFVTLYLAGRYLRLYAKVPSAKWILLVLVGCQVGALTMELGLSHFLGFSFTSLENDNSLTTFVSAVCIFLLFTKLHFHSRIVNLLAINVLAVYVLHMNEVAWPFIARVFSLSSMHGMGIVAACVYVPVIVFTVASVIEWGRRSLTSIFVH